MTSTATAERASFNPSAHPMRLRPDQRESWAAMSDRVMDFDGAAELVRAAHAADGERTDIAAGALDRVAVAYHPHEGTALLLKTREQGGRILPASEPIELRAHAFRQLCARANAPADYLSRIPAKLGHACLQHGLLTSAADKDGLIRLAGGEARAIVSARYAPLDDVQILDVVAEVLSSMGLRHALKARAIATGPVTALRLTLPGEARAVRVGDVVEYGLDITNGELGNRSVMIDPVTYRLVCANGMRGWTRTGHARRLRHIGDPARLRETLVDAIPAALADASGQVDLLRAATDRLIDDVADEFGMLASRFGLQQNETRGVARQVYAERRLPLPESPADWPTVFGQTRDLTAFEVIQGVTAYARDLGTERRLELEESALRYATARAR